MATNPMLQAVMLFQHHQTTTPFAPVPPGSLIAARDVTKEKQPGPDPDEEEEEENNEEEQKQGEEDNG